METVAYSRPIVTDHGSLVELTADFDLEFVGSVAKTVVLAQISAVITPGGTPDGGGGGGGSGQENPFLPSAGEVSPDGEAVGPGVDVDPPGGGDEGGDLPDQESGDGTGGTAGDGGRGTAGDGGAAGVVEAGGSGKLPFTGYAALAVAAIGATFTGTGVAVRAALRRRS